CPQSASFFFSSRRRHTRSKRDWSSDVCSSDLGASEEALIAAGGEANGNDSYGRGANGRANAGSASGGGTTVPSGSEPRCQACGPIGRASCRGRGEEDGFMGVPESRAHRDNDEV